LYTTPVIYLYLDRLSLWFREFRGGRPIPRVPHRALVPGE
jgi:hypothetical protein